MYTFLCSLDHHPSLVHKSHTCILSLCVNTAQQMTKEFRPDPSDKHYTFEDVQGIDEAKAEVKEIVEFLKNPAKFQRLGAKLPTGMHSYICRVHYVVLMGIY